MRDWRTELALSSCGEVYEYATIDKLTKLLERNAPLLLYRQEDGEGSGESNKYTCQ
jgi:hypothetical protein